MRKASPFCARLLTNHAWQALGRLTQRTAEASPGLHKPSPAAVAHKGDADNGNAQKHRKTRPFSHVRQVPGELPRNSCSRVLHAELGHDKICRLLNACTLFAIVRDFPVPGLTGSGEFCGSPRSNAAQLTHG